MERSASRVRLSLGDVLPDSLRVASGRRKHTPAASKLDRYSAWRNLQDILQRQAAAALPMLSASAIRTATKLARLMLLKPGAARHRNIMGAIPWSRATCETVAPGLSVSSTMACFSASVKLRRGLGQERFDQRPPT